MKKITIDAKHSWMYFNVMDLHHFRWVFWMLMLRDIKLRYKQTVLGIAWVILQPLLTALLFTILFGKVMHLPSDGMPYTLFAFCGLVPWLVFSQSLQRANTCLINDRRLITKVYFPRVFIPLSATFGVIIDYLIALAMLFVLMALYGKGVSSNLAFFPLCTLVLFIFSSGINLFFSSLNVYYRDFKHIIPFLMQLWMYASPLVYSGSIIPDQYRWIYRLNPLAGIIDGFRWCLLGLDHFPTDTFYPAAITSFLLLAVGGLIFRKFEHNFADII